MVKAPSFLLEFPDLWQDLHATGASFEKLIKPSEALTLELLRELTTQRRATCEKSTRGIPSEATAQFSRYLPALAKLCQKEAELKSITVDWTSPLAGKPNKFYRLSGISKELAMGLWQYAGALRQVAYEEAVQVQKQRIDYDGRERPPASDEVAVSHTTAAVTKLREAAGVFEFLCSKVLPPLKSSLPGDRPAELMGSMSFCLHHVCLAEAQVVAAHRAADRGSSAAVVAALHVGASDEFDRAAKVLRENTGDFNTVSDRLRKFLAVNSSVAKARAYRYIATQLREKGEPAQGEAACVEADSRLNKCLELSDSDAAWKLVLQHEQDHVQYIRRRCHNDRTLVYFQSLPDNPPALPAGSMLVKQAVPYILDIEDSINATLVLEDKS